MSRDVDGSVAEGRRVKLSGILATTRYHVLSSHSTTNMTLPIHLSSSGALSTPGSTVPKCTMSS
jgi:hypothetical protein